MSGDLTGLFLYILYFQLFFLISQLKNSAHPKLKSCWKYKTMESLILYFQRLKEDLFLQLFLLHHGALFIPNLYKMNKLYFSIMDLRVGLQKQLII